VHAYGHDVADRWLLRDEVIESGNEFGYRSIRPGSIRPTSAPNAVVPPLVLGRSAPTPIGLSISFFATISSTEPIAVDLSLT